MDSLSGLRSSGGSSSAELPSQRRGIQRDDQSSGVTRTGNLTVTLASKRDAIDPFDFEWSFQPTTSRSSREQGAVRIEKDEVPDEVPEKASEKSEKSSKTSGWGAST